MQINGIEIRDIKDAQDVLMALETIRGAIEVLSESMSDNYNGYSGAVSNQTEIIESINHLMIESKKIIDNINILNNNTKIINKDTVSKVNYVSKEIIEKIESEREWFIKEFDSTLQSKLDSIDKDNFTNQANKIYRELSYLNSQILEDSKALKENLTKNSQTLEQSVNKSLKSIKEEISSDLNSLREEKIKVFKRPTIIGYVLVALVSTFVGSILGAYMKFDFVVSYIVPKAINNANKELSSKEINIERRKYELEKREQEVEREYKKFKTIYNLYTFLQKNNIKPLSSGYTTHNGDKDRRLPYISFESKRIESIYPKDDYSLYVTFTPTKK
jgi:hypothetical protein